MSTLAWAFVALAVLGVVQALAGWFLARRFAGRAWTPPADLPPITVLKPLHGDEPLLQQEARRLRERCVVGSSIGAWFGSS